MLGFLPLPHKVTIESAVSLDDWGIAVPGKSQTIKARVSYNTRKEVITVASGESIVFTARVLLDGLPEIDYEDYLIFDTGRGRTVRKQPIEIDYKFDLSGSPIAVSVIL